MALKKETDKSLSMKEKELSIRKKGEEKEKVTKKENPLKNQVKNYKRELEESDDGIKSAGQLTEKSYKTTKSTSKAISKANQEMKKRSKQKKIEKQEDNQLNKTKKKLMLDKNKNKKNFVQKAMSQPKKVVKNSVNQSTKAYEESLTSSDDGVKTAVKGTKGTGQLVKKGTKSIEQARKNRNKDTPKTSKKLRGADTKLQKDRKTIPLTKAQATKKSQNRTIRKTFMKRNIQQAQKTRSLTVASRNVGRTMKLGLNNAKRVIMLQLKRLTGIKVFSVIGALVVKLLPVGLVLGLFFVVAMIFAGNQSNSSGGLALSEEVEQWRGLVTEVANSQGMNEYIDLILAIIQVESGGKGTRDIMQSSESAGHPPGYFQTEIESVEQGVTYIKKIVNLLTSFDKGYKNDYKLIAQSYNFGIGFASYTHAQKVKSYDLNLAEKYSKEVVAWSLGNKTGETYPYKNEISTSLGKPYLYRNGGNFMYAEMVGQYLFSFVEGEMAPPVEPFIVTSHFGNRVSPGGIGSTNHKGIDLGCHGGITPINSLAAGEVITSSHLTGFGNTVVVKHSNDFYTTYAHMSKLNVKVGQSVKAGQSLGICGSTGNSTGPHLHLEISPEPHKNQVDPYPYIKHFEN